MFKSNPFAKKMGPQKPKYTFEAPVQEPTNNRKSILFFNLDFDINTNPIGNVDNSQETYDNEGMEDLNFRQGNQMQNNRQYSSKFANA